ncbi:hypothetical protein DOY81_008435, partial [Sarcophaga bullata]
DVAVILCAIVLSSKIEGVIMKSFVIICAILICSMNSQGTMLGEEQTTDNEVEILTALFTKLNWLVTETKQIQEELKKIRIRQTLFENLRKSNLNMLKESFKVLMEQQDFETSRLMTSLNVTLLENFDQKIKLFENIINEMKTEIKAANTFNIRSFKENRQWQCILRRQDGSVNFTRNWQDYKQGFGNANGEFFIGLEQLHRKTNYEGRHELLIILQDFNNHTRYAKYDEFVVGSEEEKYKIKNLGHYQGDAGDSLSQHLNSAFSSLDQDNDNSDASHCAVTFQSGWWFNNCYAAHLTAPYLKHALIAEKGLGIVWNSWHGSKTSLQFVEMLIREK